mmetsp:Transcript_32950/g.72271  ORF Transcript_32950/g.72271 Transcript_32950/m.72271 type:complete len:254 (+) Transcript_32950:132-893(+)
MPRRALLKAAAAGLAVTAIVSPPAGVSAFQTTMPVSGSTYKSRKRTSPSNLYAGAISEPPMPSPFREDERRRKKKKDDGKSNSDDDWTETEGGFLPNILRTRTKPKTKKPSPRDLITDVETIQDYKTTVADEDEKITVVRFYAKWCRSCRASEPQFFKMVGDFADRGVKFVQVPLKRENAYLHEGLGVPSVPYVHFYHPDGGLVEEMKMNKKKFAKVRKTLEQYVMGSCDLADEPVLAEAEDDEEGTPIGEFQ